MGVVQGDESLVVVHDVSTTYDVRATYDVRGDVGGLECLVGLDEHVRHVGSLGLTVRFHLESAKMAILA